MSAGCILAEVGQFYWVPCMRVAPTARTYWTPPDGWVPVLGPKHRDQEHLDFDFEHYHIDWRFVPEREFRAASSGIVINVPHNKVLTNDSGPLNLLVGEPVLKRRRCRRLMPEFPQIVAETLPNRRHVAIRWERLERAQAFTCNKLKPGNICPHRGIDLTPFEQPDGTAVCPGHGMRWNLRTGELMPRHGVEQGSAV